MGQRSARPRARPPAGAEAVHAASLRSPAPLYEEVPRKKPAPLAKGGPRGVGAEEVPAAQKTPARRRRGCPRRESAIARPPYEEGPRKSPPPLTKGGPRGGRRRGSSRRSENARPPAQRLSTPRSLRSPARKQPPPLTRGGWGGSGPSMFAPLSKAGAHVPFAVAENQPHGDRGK